jgi:hypothetical protein
MWSMKCHLCQNYKTSGDFGYGAEVESSDCVSNLALCETLLLTLVNFQLFDIGMKLRSIWLNIFNLFLQTVYHSKVALSETNNNKNNNKKYPNSITLSKTTTTTATLWKHLGKPRCRRVSFEKKMQAKNIFILT